MFNNKKAEVSHIKDFKMGFFVGNFEPSLYQSKDVEVGHHFYEAGFVGPKHFHRKTSEINYIISGKVLVDGAELVAGHIFSYDPMTVANVEFLEDTNLIIVKTPSIPGDKVLV